MTSRRRFLVGAAGLFTARPRSAEAQEPRKVRIGYLADSLPSDTQEFLDALRLRLRDLGYVEGQNLVIEPRYAEGRHERLAQLAADLVRLKVDVIVTCRTPAAVAAKKATTSIPIVFGFVADPLSVGLVANLTRPGGNVTGVTTNNPELSAKRVSLLKEAIPAVSRAAVLANPNFQPTPAMVAETRRAARSLGIELQVLEVREPGELSKAFQTMTTAKAHAVLVLPDPMLNAQWRRTVELAATSRIPAMYVLRETVEAGGLISYGVDGAEAFRQAAVLVDKILKGAKPAELPVEQPWRFVLAINMKTANALGLTIPPSLLLQADQVIR